ncbi:MAG: hypothetical protein M2R45_02338 [Verrucomicrobia subdivision 3 bacterium]|nr:hypothetical protein [Limisphaerales bacterium]MCS1414890.1 hypothetical protein [Limisphaerales bacterium]
MLLSVGDFHGGDSGFFNHNAVAKDGLKTEVTVLAERIGFVLVAAGTFGGESEKCRAERVHPIG